MKENQSSEIHVGFLKVYENQKASVRDQVQVKSCGCCVVDVACDSGG
jgi:hypothetical protein